MTDKSLTDWYLDGFEHGLYRATLEEQQNTVSKLIQSYNETDRIPYHETDELPPKYRWLLSGLIDGWIKRDQK